MPMPTMIWLAVLVEAAIGNWVDMLILLLIQFVNAFIAWCAAPPIRSFLCSSSVGMSVLLVSSYITACTA